MTDLFKKEAPVRLDYFRWESPGEVIRGIIHGELPNKSNSRQIIYVRTGRGKKPMLIKSPKARDFVETVKVVAMYSKLAGLPLVGCTNQDDWKKGQRGLFLEVDIYVDNFMRDVDIELLKDCLQETGIINNDRGVWTQRATRKVDKDNPRIEFTIGIWDQELRA